MSDKIEFVRNYHDLSTDRGFQFEFTCDRCHTGYRTAFKPSLTGTVSGVLDAASSFLGGIFGTAADLTERVHTAAWRKARDEALMEAIAAIRPDFIQCPKCLSWVCRKSCWNTKHGLCKNCAPDIGVEMAAAQASKTVEHIWENADVSTEDKKIKSADWQEAKQALCPQCEAPINANAKFCPECGAKLKIVKYCPDCGAEVVASAKFCADCGCKV